MNKTRFYDKYFNEVTPAGESLYSQTPWTSDIDAAGNNLVGADNIQCANGVIVGGGWPILSGTVITLDDVQSSDGNSFVHIASDSNFGIHNGEPSGSGGENINLVSDNGVVIWDDVNISATSGAFLSDSSARVLVVSNKPGAPGTPQAAIAIIANDPAAEYSTLFLENPTDAAANGGIACQRPPGTHNFALNVIGTGDALEVEASTGNIYLNPSASTTQFVIVGGITTDVTGAPFQVTGDASISGSYWAQNNQGVSGISVLDADGVTTHSVVGGIIVSGA